MCKRYQRVEPIFNHFFESYRACQQRPATTASAMTSRVVTSPAARDAAALPLPARLCALSSDLQAATRYDRLATAAVLQHNSSKMGTLQSKKMVCSVALDRTDEFLATVGAPPASTLQ